MDQYRRRHLGRGRIQRPSIPPGDARNQRRADDLGKRRRPVDDALFEDRAAPLQEHVGEQAVQQRGAADRRDLLANGLLDHLGISGAHATAIHEGQTGHPLWRSDVGLQDDANTHAVPDEDGRRQVQGSQQGAHVGPVRLDVALLQPGHPAAGVSPPSMTSRLGTLVD